MNVYIYTVKDLITAPVSNYLIIASPSFKKNTNKDRHFMYVIAWTR